MVILGYGNDSEAEVIFESARHHLQAQDYLHDFKSGDDYFQFKDRDGLNHFFRRYRDMIWMAQGWKESMGNKVFQNWKNHADRVRAENIVP